MKKKTPRRDRPNRGENRSPTRETGAQRKSRGAGLIVAGILLAVAGASIWLAPTIVGWSPFTLAPRENDPWFRNVIDESGIDFVLHSGSVLVPGVSPASIKLERDQTGEKPALYFPEIMTGGAGWLDYDRDGLLDLFLVQAGRISARPQDRPSDKLYRNRGDGTFEDVTARAGLDSRGFGMGCTVGDFDNNGFPDIYVSNVGANALLRNNGDGTFTDISGAAGVGHAGFSAGAVFVDYDRDDDLDLFVVNYVAWSLDEERLCDTPADVPSYCGPLQYEAPAPDVLYRNNGNGTFTDVSVASGISSAYGNGLGVVAADINNDGWMDLCVANDETANQLWINAGDGIFRDEALIRATAFNADGLTEAGMGIDAVDVDNDGDIDFLMTHFEHETNTLYINYGSFFEDRSLRYGLAPSRPFTDFGTALADFDNDGALDTYVANGRVNILAHGFLSPDDPFAEPNQLYRGLNDGTLALADPAGGTATPLIHTSRGVAFADYDNDGDLDMLVANRDDRPYLLKNIVGQKNSWLGLSILNGFGSPAIGARVTVRAGKLTLIRDVKVAYSYCSSNDPRVYFGLGALTEVDDVSIRWPDGTVQSLGPTRTNHILQVQYPHR